MYSRSDLVIEAVSAGVAAIASAVVLDRLQIGRRAMADLGRGPPPSGETIFRLLARARLAEAVLAMLVFRGTMAGTRRLLRTWGSEVRLDEPVLSPPGLPATRGRRASPGSAPAI